MKHTPGPWKAVRPGEFCDHWEIVSDDEFAWNIACAWKNIVDDPDGEANARLIAAAPELLAALESIENDCGHIPGLIWEMRNAAIAKARGGEE